MEILILATFGLLAAATLATYVATGVAPVPSSRAARRAALEMLLARLGAPHGSGTTTIHELGCGFGALVVDLARALPAARVVGVELSPIPFAVAWLRARRLPNAEVRFGDFFRRPLGDAAAVVCYLMLRPMPALAAKLDRELAPGTPVVALGFLFRGRPAEETRRVAGVFPMEVAVYRWASAAE